MANPAVAKFTRKVGPLPVWAWAALLLVGYYAYNHYKNAQSPTNTSAGTQTGADTTQTGTYVPGFDSPSGYGGQGIYNGTPPGPTGPPGPAGPPGPPGPTGGRPPRVTPEQALANEVAADAANANSRR